MSRRGVTPEAARELVRTRTTVIGAIMVDRGEADALITGPTGRFQSHVRHIQDVLGLRPDAQDSSTVHLVILERGALFMADTYVSVDPPAEEIAETTLLAADTVRRFGIEPKVALLSHSNFGSLETASAAKMRRALALIRARAPELEVDGEMHADAALSAAIRARILPDSQLSGEANLLIFPNLDAANIAFNLLKVVTNSVSVGPILVGPAKPAHVRRHRSPRAASSTYRRSPSWTRRSRMDDPAVTELGTQERPQANSGAPAVLSEELVRVVDEALHAGEVERAIELVASLHAADQADLLEQLGYDERTALVAELKPSWTRAAHLSRRDGAEGGARAADPEEAGAAIAQLDTDDAIEVLGDLDETEQIAILQTLPMPERAAVEQGLTYPEDSAGRLMQRELVAAPEFWTVGQTIDYLRAKPDLPDEFYDIYIVNPRFEPVGSIPLSKLVRSKRGVLLTELKMKELHLIPFDMDQEEVGFLFRQYGLVSAPVVDANRRLLGVITVDDVVHVIEEEAEEDLLGLGGVQERHLHLALAASMQRVPWLLMSLVSSTLSASVIALFNHSIRSWWRSPCSCR